MSKDKIKELVKSYEKVYVIDTNIILDSAMNILQLSQKGTNLIVVPFTVLEELRKYKVGFEDINYNARQFNRALDSAEVIENITDKTFYFDTLNKVNKTESEAKLLFTNIAIENDVVNLCIIKQPYDLHIQNDDRIVNDAKSFSTYHNDVIMLSNDIDVRTTAILEGLKTEALRLNVVEDINFNFHLEIITEENIRGGTSVETVEKKCGIEIDKGVSCLTIMNPITGKPTYFTVVNGVLRSVDETDLNRMVISPINLEQKFFASLILDESVDVVCVDAKAGTGKSAISISSAMRLLDLHKDKYNKVVYIRNPITSVDKDAELGFMKGGLEEKMMGYMIPLNDTLNFIIEQKYKKKKGTLSAETLEEEINNLKGKYQITSPYIGYLRGATLSNAVIIIDEASNLSRKSMQLVLSRVGKNSKVIVIGSLKQIDSIYLNKFTNALTHLLKHCSEDYDKVTLRGCNLNKSVRSNLSEWVDTIFDNK